MKTGQFAPWLPKKYLAQEKQLVEHYYYRDRMNLSEMLLSAIDNMDSKTFFDFGRAIEFLKTGRIADPLRHTLLTTKLALDKSGRTMTIREVAELVDWPDMQSVDGFSQLRRVCRELNFPLARSRQIRGK